MCSTSSITLSIVHSSICIILFATVVYALIRFMLTLKHEETNKIGKICPTIFIISTALSLILHATMTSESCYGFRNRWHSATRWTYVLSYICFYIIQSFTLLIIFFNRIFNVFRKTRYRLSICTKNVYISLFIIELFCGMLMLFSIVHSTPIILWIFAATFFSLLITLMISLVSLFAYKLIQVYKHLEDSSDDSLVAAITKPTILVSVSVFVTFIRLISLTIRIQFLSWSDYMILKWVDDYITICDIYTNFVCVILSYKVFKIYYIKLCSVSDSKCRNCWSNIVNYEGRKMLTFVVQSNSVPPKKQISVPVNSMPQNSNTASTVTSTSIQITKENSHTNTNKICNQPESNNCNNNNKDNDVNDCV
eukprot:449237_1